MLTDLNKRRFSLKRDRAVLAAGRHLQALCGAVKSVTISSLLLRASTQTPGLFLRVLFVALLVAIPSLVGAPPASAHAFLLRSTPLDGATLDQAPAALRLTFDEDILLREASVTLRSSDGSVLLRSGPALGATDTSNEAGPELVVGLPATGQGTFSATWSVRSADDLHQTTGTVSFAVGQTYLAQGVDPAGPVPQALSSSLRWLDFTGIALLLGALLLIVAVTPRSQIGPSRRAALRSRLWCVVTVTAASELLLGIAVLIDSAGGTDVLGMLTSAHLGRLWLLREASFAAAAVTSFLAARHRGSVRAYAVATTALTVGSLAAVVSSSHVGVGAERPFALLLLLAHLGFASAWAGAVLLLLVFLVLERVGASSLTARPLLRPFGAPAVCCVAVAVVTGIALTARQVASVDALLTTAYGQILIVKVAGFGIAGLLGLKTTIRLRRARSARIDSLSGAMVVESVALLLVIAAAGALSIGTPARGPAFAPHSAAGTPGVSAQVGDLLESATLAPNAVGRSWLRVDVNQTRRPAPAPVTGVTAALLGPDSLASATRSLAKTEIANRWELGGVDLTAAGSWQMTITVQRVGRPDTVWRANWIVQDNPAGARAPLIDDRPWGSALNHAALLIAILAFGAAFIAACIERRRRRGVANAPEASTQSQQRMLERL